MLGLDRLSSDWREQRSERQPMPPQDDQQLLEAGTKGHKMARTPSSVRHGQTADVLSRSVNYVVLCEPARMPVSNR